MPIADAVEGYHETEATNLQTVTLARLVARQLVLVEALDYSLVYVKHNNKCRVFTSRSVEQDLAYVAGRKYTVARLIFVGAAAEATALRFRDKYPTWVMAPVVEESLAELAKRA